MAGRINPALRHKLPRLTEHVQHCINQCEGTPHPETGKMGELTIAGCETRERADDLKKQAHRAARDFGVSVSCKVERADDDTYSVTLQVFHKDYARKYMVDKYGPDANAWPYRPGRKAS